MEKKASSKKNDTVKNAIRTRYRGTPDEIEVIPAISHPNVFLDGGEKRVAIYVRVSTDDPHQTTSFELQKNYYDNFVKRHENWQLIDIYADEGISGTSVKKRIAFLRMFEDCEAGKIDLIVTKSVSRFSRNVVDCLTYVRRLASLQPPVGVFFEIEGIYTLNGDSEMGVSLSSTWAQEDSHSKSKYMNASIEMRFQGGIFLTPPLLGYDQDEGGNLVVNEEEAKTVRLVFFMYLYGYSSQQIAETLMKLKRTTKKNNTEWSSNAVVAILQNERHCGDVLARKTWTPDYLTHKSKKNRQNRNQYRKQNDHEAIISRDDFIAVQRLISNAKYGNIGFLPELKVIADGVLKGFVAIHPRWGAFQSEDYKKASESVSNAGNHPSPKPLKIEVQIGDFDLRSFEIVRSQFFDISAKLCVTFSCQKLCFSSACVRKFPKSLHVEMLVHPGEHLFAVRKSTKECKTSVKWAKFDGNNYYACPISGMAYLHAVYESFGWNPAFRYRVRGVYRQKDGEPVILFNLRETEVLIVPDEAKSSPDGSESAFPKDIQPLVTTPSKNVVAFPAAWSKKFGRACCFGNFEARELTLLDQDGAWDVAAEGQPYNGADGLNVTRADVVDGTIKLIIDDMGKE